MGSSDVTSALTAADIAALYAVTADLTTQHDLSALFQLIMERATALLNASAGTLYLQDVLRGYLTLTAQKDTTIAGKPWLRWGEGLAGRVAATREPLQVDNYSAWPHRLPQFEGVPFHAMLAVPLLHHDELIGVLEVGELNQPNRCFTAADAQLLQRFATQAALAIQNARLFEETRQYAREAQAFLEQMRTRTHELITLSEVSYAASQSLDLQEMLALTLDKVLEVTGFTAGEVLLVNTTPFDMRRATARHLPEALLQELPTGLATYHAREQVIQSGHPIYLEDFATLAEQQQIAMREGFQSAALIPLQAKGQILGILGMFAHHPYTFDEQERKLLASIGQQVGLALANAQLFANLAEERQRLSTVLEHVADGIIITDTEGRIIAVNQPAASLFESRIEWMNGVACGELVRARSPQAEKFDELFRQVMLRREALSLTGHLTIQAQDTKYSKILDISIVPVVSQDELNSLVIALWDVSKRVEIEQLRSSLIAIVSHELRTPMAKVRLAAEQLRRPALARKQRNEMLDIVISETDRLSKFAEEMLDVSGIEEGKIELQRAPLALPTFLRQLIKSYQRLTNLKRFELVLPKRLPPLLCDEAKVRITLNNLIDNALRYSPPDAPIQIEVALVDTHQVRLTITDHGLGMTPEQAQNLFQPFHRLHSNHPTIYGRGLGLYIARVFVEAHGGQITVKSQPGVGSTFSVILPIV
jgi:PAS domain S-box-containing protein